MRPCLIDRTLTKGQADAFYLARNLDSETPKMLWKMSVVISCTLLIGKVGHNLMSYFLLCECVENQI